jgi:hypothetical protein
MSGRHLQNVLHTASTAFDRNTAAWPDLAVNTECFAAGVTKTPGGKPLSKLANSTYIHSHTLGTYIVQCPCGYGSYMKGLHKSTYSYALEYVDLNTSETCRIQELTACMCAVQGLRCWTREP